MNAHRAYTEWAINEVKMACATDGGSESFATQLPKTRTMAMTNRDKFIEDLKAGGYIPGDLSTLPSDISEDDRRKVEQYEADQANERMKNTQGQKPTLGKFHVELNPNQYGFAEQAAVGDDTNSKLTKPEKTSDQSKVKQDNPAPDADPVDNRVKADTKRDPLDHDNNGRKGGSAVNK